MDGTFYYLLLILFWVDVNKLSGVMIDSLTPLSLFIYELLSVWWGNL